MILNPKYAPVLILTLNRDLHFKNCVESLSKCLNADKTDLFIALDYPLNDSHYEGFDKIIKIIDTISGFKTINIIRRDVNYGIPRNFEDAMDKIFSVYDRVILSEDDNQYDQELTGVLSGKMMQKSKRGFFNRIEKRSIVIVSKRNFEKDKMDVIKAIPEDFAKMLIREKVIPSKTDSDTTVYEYASNVDFV